MSSLDRSVVTRSFYRHSTVLSSFNRYVVTRPFCRRSRGGSARIALSWLLVIDSSLAVTRQRSFSRSPLERSLAVTRLALYGYSSWIALSQSLGEDRSLAVPWIDLSRSLDSLSFGHSTRSLRLLIMDSSLAVTRRRSFSRSRLDRSLTVTRLALSQSLGADRSLAVARIDLSRSLKSLSCSHSSRIILLLLLVTDRSLAVTRLGSLSRSHSDCSQVSSMT